MARFTHANADIHYTLTGDPDGFPVLLIAPGGMRSAAAVWNRIAWNPLERLTDYKLIAMDQRNAGLSQAPVTADDGWGSYTADQLALLDHLGVEQCHVVGMCIGGPYIMGLLKAAPERFRSAVIFQPVGLDGNRDAFFAMFDAWADDIRADHPEADAAAWAAFKQAMYGGDAFLFNTTREEAAACDTPILLFKGDDLYHPAATSIALANLAPNVTFIEQWKEPDLLNATHQAVQAFLGKHTPRPGLTYADAGVNIDAANDLVRQIAPMAARTRVPGVVSGLGGFGGLFDLAAAGVWAEGDGPPLLVSSTDGVGTKLKLAFTTGQHDTIGVDCVAMCVNDLLTTGAKPLFFLDYFATGRLTPDDAAAVIGGVATGCELAGCALLGGETAEMPGMYADGEYDLAGFAVGAVPRDHLLPKLDAVEAGQLLIGVASTGFHSNGFSLVRRVVDDRGLDLAAAPDGFERSLAALLLEPTAIYADVVGAWLDWGEDAGPRLPLTAMAHITGGGLVENIPRVLPEGLGARVDASAWTRSPLFDLILTAGGVPADESWRVFNMGIGLVAVVPASHADEVVGRAKAVGREAWVIGEVVVGEGVTMEG